MAYKFVDSGAGGANNGNDWANAWTSIVSANGVAADTIVLVKGGTTYDAQDGGTSSCLNASGNGTISQPVTYQGDDASGGAGEGNPATFTLDANTNNLDYAAIPAQHTVWNYVIFTGSNTGGLHSSSQDTIICYECVFHTAGTYGARVDDDCYFIGCTFYGNTNGLDADDYLRVIGCRFYNNSGSDLLNSHELVAAFNLFNEDNNVTCMKSSHSFQTIINNTFDGYGDGIGIDFTAGGANMWPMVINNCFYDLATGMQHATDVSGCKSVTHNNLFNSNSANDETNMSTGFNVQTGAPNFVTEGTDYHPDTGSPLIDNGLDAGDIGV